MHSCAPATHSSTCGQEKKRQAEGRYDSNLREARAIRLGLEALLSKAPLAGAFIAWASDSFGTHLLYKCTRACLAALRYF